MTEDDKILLKEIVANLPDLSNYHGVCPVCNGEKRTPSCLFCEGTGVVSLSDDKKHY